MNRSLPSVTIVRKIKASPAKVWAAITRPEQMLQLALEPSGIEIRCDRQRRRAPEQSGVEIRTAR